MKATIDLLNMLIQGAKDDVLKAGPELYRIIPYVSNISGMTPILNELKEPIKDILSPCVDDPVYNSYIGILVPLKIEKKLEFILRKVKRNNASRYVQWLINSIPVGTYFTF